MTTDTTTRPILARLAALETPAVWAVLLAGAVLRVGQYLSGRSLWLDEAMLALNIQQRSAWVLVSQPLGYAQGAPLGFLAISKLAVSVFGVNDASLRAVPLLGGIVSLFLMWRVARRTLTGPGPLLALALFAVSEQVIYYASEVKQYSTDVTVALALWLGGLRVVSTGVKPRTAVLLGLLGAVAVWMSHPAAFVLAGVGTALGVEVLRRRDRGSLPWLGLTFGMWLLSFAGVYALSLRGLAANGDLLDYWQGNFFPTPVWTGGPWLVKAMAHFLWNPARLPFIGFGALTLLAGCVALAWMNRPAAIMLLVPFPAVLLASALHKYPFGDRLVLFLVPAVVLLIAAAAEGARRLFWERSVLLATLGFAAVTLPLLLPPAFEALYKLKHPRTREEIKPVLAYLHQHRLPGDDIFVYDGALYAFMYYAPRYGITSDDYRTGICVRRVTDECEAALQAERGRRRVWFVFAHDWSDREPQFQTHLADLGSKLDEFNAPGASLLLYDLGGAAPAPPPHPATRNPA